MKRFKVYLAGPISGLTYDGAQDWREHVGNKLNTADTGIIGYSPLRAKQYLREYGVIEQSYEATPLSTDKGITARDRNDVKTSDVVLFNFLGASRISIGTCIELGWADAYRIPMVLVIEKENNPHDHPIARDVCGFRTGSLDEAVQIVKRILLP